MSLTNGLILSEKLFPASREQDPVPGHIPTRELSVHKPHGRSIIAYLELVGIHGADKVQAEIGLLDLESGEVIDVCNNAPECTMSPLIIRVRHFLSICQGSKISGSSLRLCFCYMSWTAANSPRKCTYSQGRLRRTRRRYTTLQRSNIPLYVVRT